MGLSEGNQAKTVWDNPAEIVRSLRPENPVLVFAPTILQDRARQFIEGFPGLVTYAVKSNPEEAVITNLVAAGIRALPKGQLESARSLGLNYVQALRLVVLPQAVRIVVPPVGNYFVSLFKDTALVSTISIAELMFTGQLIASDTFKYMRIYSVVFIIYVVISVPASLGVRWLEARLASDRPRRSNTN